LLFILLSLVFGRDRDGESKVRAIHKNISVHLFCSHVCIDQCITYHTYLFMDTMIPSLKFSKMILKVVLISGVSDREQDKK
jgi:hypothetical protein